MDELEINPFFRALQTQYLTLFRWAQDSGGIVCVPISRSIRGRTLDKDFIERHVYRPSPYLKDHFVMKDKAHCCTVLLEGNTLATKEGFVDERVVRIQGEEVGYNQNSKIFRIYLIDQPLFGPVTTLLSQEEENFLNFTDRPVFSECRTYLGRLEECTEAVRCLDMEIERFISNYMVLSGYIDEAANRLQQIYQQGGQAYLCQARKSLRNDTNFIENVNLALECAILGSVYDKVFPVVCQQCQQDDGHLESKCIELNGLNASQLALPHTLSCDLLRATNKLDCLDTCVTPTEKLVCLKEVLESITEDVRIHQLKCDSKTVDIQCLTSDEYIPLLVLVIVQVRGCHLASNVYYIDTFKMVSMRSDCYSFALVTFKAACKYLLSLQHHSLKRNCSLAETVPAPPSDQSRLNETKYVSGQINRVNSEPGRQVKASGEVKHSQWDRELDRISQQTEASMRQFEEATKSTAQRSKSGYRPVSTSAFKNTTLGDFLTSLKDDKQPCSYGKQS